MMIVTPEQIHAARALLRLEQDELARRAHVPVVTIRSLEAPEASGTIETKAITKIREALERSGVEFIPDGVKRREPVQAGRRASLEQLRDISFASARLLADRDILADDDLFDENGLPH